MSFLLLKTHACLLSKNSDVRLAFDSGGKSYRSPEKGNTHSYNSHLLFPSLLSHSQTSMEGDLKEVLSSPPPSSSSFLFLRTRKILVLKSSWKQEKRSRKKESCIFFSQEKCLSLYEKKSIPGLNMYSKWRQVCPENWDREVCVSRANHIISSFGGKSYSLARRVKKSQSHKHREWRRRCEGRSLTGIEEEALLLL